MAASTGLDGPYLHTNTLSVTPCSTEICQRDEDLGNTQRSRLESDRTKLTEDMKQYQMTERKVGAKEQQKHTGNK